MARLASRGVLALSSLFVAACSGSTPAAPIPDDASVTTDAGAASDASDAATCATPPCPQSKIEHVIVVVMENKTFDVELGRYCTAATGSSPTCTDGPSCCEAGPAKEPSGASPVNLDDAENGNFDPNHNRDCEVGEVNGGAMDKFVAGTACSGAHNFAYVDPTIAKPLWDLVPTGALADRYFQPVIGASSGNDQYFARAQWVFDDNASAAGAVGQKCDIATSTPVSYTTMTIADLLTANGVGFTFYAEGYAAGAAAAPGCPPAPTDCPFHLSAYPCVFAPGDDPFEFYDSTRDKAPFIADLSKLATDLAGGALPAVGFVKAIGYKTDHPGQSATTSAAVSFITATVNQVLASSYASSTLVLVTYDEGGGYFDHVHPPDTNTADNQPYGTRVPLMAFGPFALKNGVSHVTMEHSSIVKFIEWNWLGGTTGQLQGRDANVHNIGSILAPSTTGVAVPQD